MYHEDHREVELDEFMAHLATGLEAWEYVKVFGHHGPRHDMRDTDPTPLAPTELMPLDIDLAEEPLC